MIGSFENIQKLKEYHKRTGASHYYSSESVLGILEAIYRNKRPQDEVILSKAHAITAQLLVEGRLPERAPKQSVFGSLGLAFPYTLGKAFVNPHINFHIVFGDGEWQEGSNWEAYHLMRRLDIDNIILHVDVNNVQGMGTTDTSVIPDGAILWYTKKGENWTYHYKRPE
jgi:transketolase N-terminal domain/subunit